MYLYACVYVSRWHIFWDKSEFKNDDEQPKYLRKTQENSWLNNSIIHMCVYIYTHMYMNIYIYIYIYICVYVCVNIYRAAQSTKPTQPSTKQAQPARHMVKECRVQVQATSGKIHVTNEWVHAYISSRSTRTRIKSESNKGQVTQSTISGQDQALRQHTQTIAHNMDKARAKQVEVAVLQENQNDTICIYTHMNMCVCVCACIYMYTAVKSKINSIKKIKGNKEAWTLSTWKVNNATKFKLKVFFKIANKLRFHQEYST